MNLSYDDSIQCGRSKGGKAGGSKSGSRTAGGAATQDTAPTSGNPPSFGRYAAVPTPKKSDRSNKFFKNPKGVSEKSMTAVGRTIRQTQGDRSKSASDVKAERLTSSRTPKGKGTKERAFSLARPAIRPVNRRG